MQIINVMTQTPYQILIGQHLLAKTASLLSNVSGYRRVVIVSDEHVAPHYLTPVAESFPANRVLSHLVLPAGERNKTINCVTSLIDFFAAQQLTRTDLVVALGGGAVGDVTGFACSIYLRGIRYVQIPTSLLAQVDASVGGKTAVNISAGKNLVGTFYQPCAVICDIATLSSLPREIFCDGIAEIIKYGCIWDTELFEQIGDIDQPDMLLQIISRCIEIKAEIVQQDEKEQGLRMLLNFGHTLGHAIEKYHLYAGCSHGQAVAIGMVHITALAEQSGLTQRGTAIRIARLLQKFGLPYHCDIAPQRLLSLCARDKKYHGNQFHVILLNDIGAGFVQPMSIESFEHFIRQPVALPHAPVRLSPAKLSGTVCIPPSKSILHRALICASLAEGTSALNGVYLSDDILTTMHCLEQMGALFEMAGSTVSVTGIAAPPSAADFFCSQSASTLRFLIPVSSALGISASFFGADGLSKRPLDVYTEILPQHHVTVRSDQGALPFTISGQLCAGDYTLPGNLSSQFISGLLFALPLLDGDSTITVTEPFESKSYVSMTCSLLRLFGITITQNGNTYHIPGNQYYRRCDYAIESDYSQAAFFLVANALGADIHLKHFGYPSLQGDCAILDILKQYGSRIVCQHATLHTTKIANHAFQIDAADIPDLVPILCVLASQSAGTSIITNTQRLRLKESDRIVATKHLLESLGGEMHVQHGTITIPGGQKLHGGEVDSHRDHRIAMCAAIAATICDDPIILHGADSIHKSYPTFFQDYQLLGGKMHVLNLE